MEVKTNTLILTFNSPKITEYLKVCYLNIPVTQFVPNTYVVINVKKLVMLQVNASTEKAVPDVQKLAIRMIHVLKHSNARTEEIVTLLIARNAVFIKGSMTFSQ